MITQKFYSPAKINLLLKVLNKRKDGFHNIFSIFHKIDLCDEILISENDKLELICDEILDIKPAENLAFRAAEALNNFTQQSKTAKITVKKRIPIGAGLGGGSSNAATVLAALNVFWKLNLEKTDLLKIAAKLGSDVPFFLQEKPAIVSGRGEIVEPINFVCDAHYLLIFPNIHINTGFAYSLLQREISENLPNYKLDFSYSNEILLTVNEIKKYLINDFEEIICNLNPELKILKNKLQKLSSGCSSMTGSGSAFFALFETKEKAIKSMKEFENSKYFKFIGKLIKNELQTN